MNTPNKKLMQELIAKLEGWMDLQFDLPQLEGLWGIPPMGAVSLLESGGYLPVPNWPGNNTAAYDLTRSDSGRFADCLAEIMGVKESQSEIFSCPSNGLAWISSKYPAMLPTAEQWCLAWIMSEHGYKWVECEKCEGKPERMGGGVVGPITAVRCSACSGKAGEFVKI